MGENGYDRAMNAKLKTIEDLLADIGYSVVGNSGYATYNSASYSNYGRMAGSAGVIDVSSLYAGDALSGNMMQAGIFGDVTFGLISVTSFGAGVNNEMKAYIQMKQNLEALRELRAIRALNPIFRQSKQAQLISQIAQGSKAVEALKIASRRLAIVGLFTGGAEAVYRGTAESWGWFGVPYGGVGTGLHPSLARVSFIMKTTSGNFSPLTEFINACSVFILHNHFLPFWKWASPFFSNSVLNSSSKAWFAIIFFRRAFSSSSDLTWGSIFLYEAFNPSLP